MVKKTREINLTMDAILVYSPEKELEVLSNLAEIGDKVDWKPAIILASTYLEKYGIEKLKAHFQNEKIKLSQKFNQISLSSVSIFLYGLKIIPEKYFTWMDQIWRERCKIVHPKGKIPAYVGKEANKKYTQMIKRALEILIFLKS